MRKQFNDVNFASLKSKLSTGQERDNLKNFLNSFLKSLVWSHTEFDTTSDETFYLFRDHSSSINRGYPSAPLIVNPEIQIGTDSNGYYAREILDGLPVKSAGVLKNDRLLTGLPPKKWTRFLRC